MKTIIRTILLSFNPNVRNSMNYPPAPRGLFLIALIAWFGLLSGTKAVEPAATDNALAGGNTADGQGALLSLTTGTFNTAIGFDSLLVNTDTSFNTGVGAGTLLLSTANQNTAVGAGALFSNTTGEDNNAVGAFALFSNTEAFFNNAHGREALFNNTTGTENEAFGDLAMQNNTTGSGNTAIGDDALRFNLDGSGNVAVGDEAGTGLGPSVSNCIAIGAPGAGPFATLDNTCFIGSIFGENVSDPGTQAQVYVDQFNVVGIFNSSRKHKHDIEPMDKSSESLYKLRPVTFKFNSDWKGTTQYGLIAEEVAAVSPQLVVQHDGETVTVRYEQVNAMLLNEFLKEHNAALQERRKVKELEETVAALVATVKDQSAQIQKVSARLELNKPTPQEVANR